jgi:hypothetical protein
MTKMTKAELRTSKHFLVTPSDFTVQFKIDKEDYDDFFKGDEKHPSSGYGHNIKEFETKLKETLQTHVKKAIAKGRKDHKSWRRPEEEKDNESYDEKFT